MNGIQDAITDWAPLEMEKTLDFLCIRCLRGLQRERPKITRDKMKA